MIPLSHFVILSAILFVLGMYAVLTRRNAIAILMGTELILNAANLNFVAFTRYIVGGVAGQMIAVFVIVLAAAEAAVALAIILTLYQEMNTISPDETQELKG
ncbi:NADH-quinone oxidoreductase subunit NuoK [Candidatus Poribacteria bacterium]|nr:NADH-quinone oxidoreductase subunit NuoK [Candidatus Poribacteria bacterium]